MRTARDEYAIPDDVAIASLPEGEYIHTFLGSIGADWPRQKVIDAIMTYGAEGAGPRARSLGHPLFVTNTQGKFLLIQADRERLP